MPQATNPLFVAADLSGLLRQTVSDDAVTVVEKVVWGWLRPLLDITERPTVLSDELSAWALELGGIAYSNPEGLARYDLETEKSFYGSERRDEILRTVATGGVTAPGAAPPARGSFPRPCPYPDPARDGSFGVRDWGLL